MEHIQYLQEGALVDERYEIVSTISCADSKAVYLCKLAEDRYVVMKVMHSPKPGEDFATTAKRFRNELVAAYKITHPNVVHVYEFIERPEFLAYTMEYVGGGNLEDYLLANQVIRPEQARKFLSQISAGLHAIHEAGIIHRELKPRNILISDEREAKITDFGVAKVENQQNLTMHGGLVGTMDYLSPEYITEGSLTKKLDVYSLGVIGYEMLTGKVPFKSDDMMTMLTARLSEDPKPLIELMPNCPLELNEIIMKALSRDPENRFSNALEMHLALDALGTLDRVAPLSVSTLDDVSLNAPVNKLSFEEKSEKNDFKSTLGKPDASLEPQSITENEQSLNELNVVEGQELTAERKKVTVAIDNDFRKTAVVEEVPEEVLFEKDTAPKEISSQKSNDSTFVRNIESLIGKEQVSKLETSIEEGSVKQRVEAQNVENFEQISLSPDANVGINSGVNLNAFQDYSEQDARFEKEQLEDMNSEFSTESSALAEPSTGFSEDSPFLDNDMVDEEFSISQLHKAVEKKSRSKISHPVFLMSIVFFVAVAAGAVVSSGVNVRSLPKDVFAFTNKIPFLNKKEIQSKVESTNVEKSEIESDKKIEQNYQAQKGQQVERKQIAKINSNLENSAQVNKTPKINNNPAVKTPAMDNPSKQEDSTLNEYKLLLGLNPTDPKVNYNLGLLYVGRGEYKTAEKYLSEAVRLDPDNSTAAYYLKRVKQKLKN